MLGRGLLIAAVAAVLDQASKYAVLRHFDEPGCGHRNETVTSFFDLVITCNRGVSFGLFNHGPEFSSAIFAVAAALVIVILTIWLARVRSPFLAAAIGLIIGGAVGNVIDRLLPSRGGVIDFLYFHIGAWYWPAFNLADGAICLGVAAMLLDGLRSRRGEQQAKGGEDLLR